MTVEEFKRQLKPHYGEFEILGLPVKGLIRHQSEEMENAGGQMIKLCPIQMLPPIRRKGPRAIAEEIGMNVKEVLAVITHTADDHNFVNFYFDHYLRDWMEEVLVGK